MDEPKPPPGEEERTPGRLRMSRKEFTRKFNIRIKPETLERRKRQHEANALALERYRHTLLR